MIYVVLNGKQIVSVFDSDVSPFPKLKQGEVIVRKSDLAGDEIKPAVDKKTPIERKLLDAGKVEVDDEEPPDTWSIDQAGTMALILIHLNDWLAEGKVTLDTNIKVTIADGTVKSITIKRFKNLSSQLALRALRQLQ